MNANTILKRMALCMPFLIMSCNDTSELMNEENATNVFFTVDKFESTSATRTTVDPTNNYAIIWASGDAIGIFPREGYQEPFVIPADQVGKASASFDGGYWALKEGLTYNAYYPFDKANFESAEMKTQIPVTYLGQEQDGTTCGIGAYDYTYSDWTEATSGSVNFKFHHIGAFAIFTLEYPATATYTKLTLSANTAVIPTTGTYDLTAEKVNFVADNDGLTSSISLTLKNCSGTAGETGTFYMMLPPMDLSGNKLALTLTSSAGTTCTYSLEPFTVVKGKKYELTGEPVESKVEGTIDGWIEETIPNNQIWYTSTDGNVVEPKNTDDFGVTILTNTYENGKGIITFNGDVTKIAASSFQQCYTLTNITIPNSVTSFGSLAFSECALKSIAIPNKVTTIGSNVFTACSALTDITISKGVTKIEDGAFSSCKSLASIIVDEENPIYDSRENCNAIIETASNTLISGCKNTTIPSSVTTIYSQAFAGCSSLTSITIPINVINLGTNLFQGCTSLSNIIVEEGNPVYDSRENCNAIIETASNTLISGCKNTIIPSSVTGLGDASFYGQNITSIIIPNSVTDIGTFAFGYCRSLTKVDIKATNPPTLGNVAFLYCSDNLEIYVPKESLDIYKSATGWKDLNLLTE